MTVDSLHIPIYVGVAGIVKVEDLGLKNAYYCRDWLMQALRWLLTVESNFLEPNLSSRRVSTSMQHLGSSNGCECNVSRMQAPSRLPSDEE